MANAKLDFLREETIRRCKIMTLDEKLSRRFTPISSELFHFFYETKSVDFPVYFKVEDVLVEYMRREEFSKELLDQIWTALQNQERNVNVMIQKADKDRFDSMIDKVRSTKINRLMEKDPALDRRTLEAFSNLSQASQLIVQGGIDDAVVNRVKASAGFLVGNLMDNDMAIATLSRMVTHDPTLYDHSASVAMLASVIGMRCVKKKLSKKELEVVSQCGLYHDVGKTCIPGAVLNKPGKFTPEEFEVMKKHAALGEDELHKIIEQGSPIDPIAARVAGEHHERFCGQGYPRGRKGRHEDDEKNGIHLFSRIVTIADVYSALLMKRVYKPGYEPQDAIKLMAQIADKEYDPEIFNSFLRSVVDSLNEYQEKLSTKEKGRILYFDESGTLQEEKRKVI